jgi:hypothetical protein
VQVRGHSAIEYDERVLEAGPADRPAPRTLRLYRRVDLERTVGDGPQDPGFARRFGFQYRSASDFFGSLSN